MTDPKLPADQGEATTPDDVATLYSWANLHGAKYRDFSASRAQAREEARLRFEEAQAAERRRLEEEAERVRQEEAQIAARKAAEAAEAARQAEAERLAEIARQAEAERQAVLAAQEAQRMALQQRGWQPPPVDVFETGYVAPAADPSPEVALEPAGALLDAAHPVYPAQAHAFADDFEETATRAAAWVAEPPRPASSEHHATPPAQPPRQAAQQQSAPPVPVQPAALYSAPPRGPMYPQAPVASFATPPQDPYMSSPWQQPEQREPLLASRPAWLAPELPAAPVAPPPAQQYRTPPGYPGAGFAAPVQPSPPAATAATPSPVQQQYGQVHGQVPGQVPSQREGSASPQPARPAQQPAYGSGQGMPVPYHAEPPMMQTPVSAPSQTYAQSPGPAQLPSANHASAGPLSPMEDTLLGSREQMTNRWFALKHVFDPNAAPAEQVPAQPPARVPILAVFSLAGGVGKTSLVASLGRALSSRGERVLLVDTAVYGLLPFFFGARDQRPGMLRTFNPPGVGLDAPIQLVTLDPENPSTEGQEPVQVRQADAHQDWLAQEVGRYTRGANRVLIDLPTASGSTTRRVLRMSPAVLVPILPDMNSVVSVGAIESFFRNSASVLPAGSKPIMPYYVLNQFDYSLPLHLDVREILREQIGDRLLPFALRRSPSVSEALAEGMTVIDYAPSAVVAEDYAQLAEWVRSLSAPAVQSYRGVRWSER